MASCLPFHPVQRILATCAGATPIVTWLAGLMKRACTAVKPTTSLSHLISGPKQQYILRVQGLF
jgi:hypothetical protein